MKGRILAAAVAMAAMGMLGSRSSADSVTVSASFDLGSKVETVGINDGNFIKGGYYYAGVYDFHVTARTGDENSTPLKLSQVPSGTIQGVCIDFTHDIAEGNTSVWTVAKLTDMAVAPDGIPDPSTHETGAGNGVGISKIQAAAIGHLWDAIPPTGVADAHAGAQLQLAVWDVLYRTGTSSIYYSGGSASNNLGDGTTDVTHADQAATDALSWAASNQGAPDVYALIDTTGLQSFSFLVRGVTPAVTATALPLPASAGVGFSMLALFGGLTAVRKRFTRKLRIA